MNPLSIANPIASGTGMMTYTLAISEAIQLLVYFTTGQSITNEQSYMLAVLVYPFIHAIMDRLKIAVPEAVTEPATPTPQTAASLPTPIPGAPKP